MRKTKTKKDMTKTKTSTMSMTKIKTQTILWRKSRGPPSSFREEIKQDQIFLLSKGLCRNLMMPNYLIIEQIIPDNGN